MDPTWNNNPKIRDLHALITGGSFPTLTKVREVIMRSDEARHRKINAVWFHSYVKSKKVQLVESESSLVATRDWELGRGRDAGQRIQTFSSKMRKFWRVNTEHGHSGS